MRKETLPRHGRGSLVGRVSDDQEIGIMSSTFCCVEPSSWSCALEPRCKKTGLRGFRPGPTQTGLYSHRR